MRKPNFATGFATPKSTPKRLRIEARPAPSLSPEERSSQSGPGHIAAALLAVEPLLQFDLGDWRRRMQVDPRPPCAADAPQRRTRAKSSNRVGSIDRT